MSAPRRRVRLDVLLGVLAALVLAGVAAWFFLTHEQVTETLPLPRRGEARSNPLFALQRALANDGVRAVSRRRLDLATLALDPRDTLVLYTDPRVIDAADADTLRAWVATGGHLVTRMPAPLPLGDQDTPLPPLLAALGLRAHPHAPACVGWRIAGDGAHVEFCQGRRFAFADVEPRLAWGDHRDGFVYARLAVGRGTVDVASELDVLTTDQLEDAAHLALARQWLAPRYRSGGTVHLVYDTQVETLWSLLARRGWMAWSPLALALLAWLFARSERFGPWLPTPPAARRAVLEHIAASGELLWRYGHGARLHAAVRDAFLARLRRRDPEAAALDGAPQAARLSARFGLPAADIADALRAPAPDDARALRTRVALLLTLRRQL